MADSVALEEEVVDDLVCGMSIRSLAFADIDIRGDGRTVYGLIVPYNREGTIHTRSGSFREVFRPGSMTRTINGAAKRVKLFENHNHLRGDAPIGVAVGFEEKPKGVYGEFRIGQSPEGDAALQKVHDGIYDAFSVGFNAVPGGERRSKDLREVTEAKLNEVSLVSYPAYADAGIEGIRSAFPELTPRVLERLLALAADLDTQRTDPPMALRSDDPSIGDDPAQGHSSTATPETAPLDMSFAARQHRARQIEVRRRAIGKRA
jgi:HK97 family phage prohead protease